METESEKVVRLGNAVDATAEALETIDSLRADVASGRIKAFACVGVEPGGATRMWMSSVLPTTRLEIIGAMHHMLHWYEADTSQ